jgi:hypothetical protein
MEEYIKSIFEVFQFINYTAKKNNDTKLGLISLVIYNYIKKLANENNIKLNHEKQTINLNTISLKPIFDYINNNQIELFDFQKISEDDIDANNEKDIERFVLTHIYYITQ